MFRILLTATSTAILPRELAPALPFCLANRHSHCRSASLGQYCRYFLRSDGLLLRGSTTNSVEAGEQTECRPPPGLTYVDATLQGREAGLRSFCLVTVTGCCCCYRRAASCCCCLATAAAAAVLLGLGLLLLLLLCMTHDLLLFYDDLLSAAQM